MKMLEGISEEIANSEHLQGIETLDGLAQQFINLKTADPFGGLDENVREKLNTSEIKDVSTLANKYVETEKRVPITPESADSYQYQFSDDTPLDETDHKLFKQESHKLGLTQAQFEGLINFDIVRMARALENYEIKRKEAVTELSSEKKLSESDISGKVERVYKALGMEDLVKRLDLNSDPQFLRAMLEINSKISEDVLMQTQTTSNANEIQRSEDGMPVIKYPSMQK
jgi:hypothetical protein